MEKNAVNCLFFLLQFITPVFLYGQGRTNHAIVIGIDSYKYPIWEAPVELKNNIDLALRFFSAGGRYHFKLAPIARNTMVTPEKIKQAITGVEVQKGDYVMIYLVGHGCQLPDNAHIEKSDMQSAFVCANAPASSDKGFLKNIVPGDSLGKWLKVLRRKLGVDGQVFLLAECCFSGGIDRDGKQRAKGVRFSQQAHFIRENLDTSKYIAPLVVFGSARAYNQSPAQLKFTSLFFSEFSKFSGGSYYNLFDKFYIRQRKEINNESSIDLTVNLDVNDPLYLRLGVFEDSIYEKNDFTRVVSVNDAYPKIREFEINLGAFDGITAGSGIKLTNAGKEYPGSVIKVKNGTSWVQLPNETHIPLRDSLWSCTVSVSDYKFSDTLYISIDLSVPVKDVIAIKKSLNQLKFISLKNDPDNGYSLVSVADKGLYIVRNRDHIGMVAVTDIRADLLKIQISHFIMHLPRTPDSSVNLLVFKNNEILSQKIHAAVRQDDTLSLFVEAVNLSSDRYYCILHIENDFIRQLVPVNFQINDSECRLSAGSPARISIGNLIVGKFSGQLLLIASETPIDLRELLLAPLTVNKRDNQTLHDLEKLINNLFMNKDDKGSTYNTGNVRLREFSYSL